MPSCLILTQISEQTVSDLVQDVLSIFIKPGRVGGVVRPYGQKQLLLVAAVERRLSGQHLVQQDAEGPPVHRAVVLLTQQDLKSHSYVLYGYLASREAKPIPMLLLKGHRSAGDWGGVDIPRGRCSQVSHRRWTSATRPACFPYTCRSLRSLCDRQSPARCCRASDPCRG